MGRTVSLREDDRLVFVEFSGPHILVVIEAPMALASSQSPHDVPYETL